MGYTDCGLYSLWVMGYGLSIWVVGTMGCFPRGLYSGTSKSVKINGFQELEKMSSARPDPENGIKTTKIKIEKFPEDQNVSNTMMRMTKTSRDEKIDSFEEKPGQIPKKSNVKEMLSSDDSMIGIEDIPQDLIFYA